MSAVFGGHALSASHRSVPASWRFLGMPPNGTWNLSGPVGWQNWYRGVYDQGQRVYSQRVLHLRSSTTNLIRITRTVARELILTMIHPMNLCPILHPSPGLLWRTSDSLNCFDVRIGGRKGSYDGKIPPDDKNEKEGLCRTTVFQHNILKASWVGSIQGVRHEPSGLGRRDCLRGLGGILVNLLHFQAQLDRCKWFLAVSEKDSVGTAYAAMKGSK
jgi:hypothetical protein